MDREENGAADDMLGVEEHFCLTKPS